MNYILITLSNQNTYFLNDLNEAKEFLKFSKLLGFNCLLLKSSKDYEFGVLQDYVEELNKTTHNEV
jgi:hypothetical protein